MSLNSSFPLIFLRLNVSQSLHQHRINQYLGLNQQLFDLGVPAMDLFSQKIVDVSSMRKKFFIYFFHEMNVIALLLQKRIQELQKELDFVLLADRFDESMVLLASKLCWPLEYVRSLKINARKKSFKVKKKFFMTIGELREQICIFQPLSLIRTTLNQVYTSGMIPPTLKSMYYCT